MFPTCQTSAFQRTELRIALRAEATVIHQGSALAARVHDLSRGGAALSALLPPPRDAAVMLELGALTVAARVAWSEGRSFGLRFETRLRATDVFRLSHQSRARVAV